MKKSVSLGIAFIAIVLLVALLVLPVSGAVASATTVTTTSPVGVYHTAMETFMSVSVSKTVPTVGDTIWVTGVAPNRNLTSGVQIWVFAGNYVNVTTVPFNADGYSYKNEYNTAGLPPAMYYVFAQSPGADGQFDIDFVDSGIYSGRVVNTNTNEMIFNFTGVGSVQDKDASQALSDAFNLYGVNDVYSKATFQLVAPGTTPQAVTTSAAAPATTAVSTAVPTTKSPLPVGITAGALLIGGCCAAFGMRKTP
jgi:hypothetical protein